MSEPKREDYVEAPEVIPGRCNGCYFYNNKNTRCPDWKQCSRHDCIYKRKDDKQAQITALFESILVEHIAASELRDLYRHKLREIIG